MGFLKKLTNVGRSIGKVVRQAAPALTLIPGVGPVAAGVIGGLGSVAEGRKLSDSLKTGLGAFGAGKVLGAGGAGLKGVTANIAKQGGYKAAGVNLLKSKLGIPASAAAAGPSRPDVIETDTRYNPDGSIASQTEIPERGLPDSLRPLNTVGAPEAGGGGWMGALKSGASWLGRNPELALAGASAFMGAKGSADASKAKDKALARLNADYEAKAPYRALALKNLTTEDPRIASLGSIFNNGRPYEVPR